MSKEIIVKDIKKGSIAEEAGIEKGDIIQKINGLDFKNKIEYDFLCSDEVITIEVIKTDGQEWVFEIEKNYEEDLGIQFDDSSHEIKRCCNKCIFCFIDQLPKGMRESLYIKDDDSYLSFLKGNFITFTNMNDEDIERMIKFRISPINVSVHTTNPKLREEMLNNKNAGKLMAILKKLSDAGLYMNCQIVLCRGINDKAELERTILDLFTLFPKVSNVAIVPVGVTRYQKNNLESYDRKSAKEVIELVKPYEVKFRREVMTPFVRLSDEFYFLAEEDLPKFEEYDDFSQLEDGVGITRYFEKQIRTRLLDIKWCKEGKSFGLITGKMAGDFLRRIAKDIEEKSNIKINIYTVDNNFFGNNITVAGLITGGDIINELKGKINEDIVLIPDCMLKYDKDVFLDDYNLEDLEKELGTRIIKCKFTGEDMIDIINGVK